MQRKFSLSYAWDKERNCYIQREGKFLVCTNNCDWKATIGTVKSTLKIPPQHNGVVPIKISVPIIEEHMPYFITDDNTSKGRDPYINIISGIHKIKGRTSVNILVSNYTNKHLTFHKGEYVGHLEPAVIHDTTIEQRETHLTNSVTLKKNDGRESHTWYIQSTTPWTIHQYPTWPQYPTEGIWIPICKGGKKPHWTANNHHTSTLHHSVHAYTCHKLVRKGIGEN